MWTIVVAAGGGSRFGGEKQFARVGDATVVDHAIATALDATDGVVVVLPAGTTWEPPSSVRAVAGGATRSDSVRAGLAVVPDDTAIVLVHDAARPLASRALYGAVIDAVRAGADGAIPVLPIVDTVKRVDGDRVVATVPRDDLVVVQTPQAFRAARLRDAHATGGVETDDAALVEAAGGTVVAVAGERYNIKITVAEDLDFVRRALGEVHAR